MKLLIATKNQKKLVELKHILRGVLSRTGKSGFDLISLAQFPDVREVAENGKTFEANAIKKAVGYAKQTKMLTLAEDSGLSVDALKEKPGVYSARFAGRGKNDRANCRKVLRLMRGVPPSKRRAKFQCVVAIAEPGRFVGVAKGEVQGFVSTELRGGNGFGYDPLFYYPPFKKTLAEVSRVRKNLVSHRKRALDKAKQVLARHLKLLFKRGNRGHSHCQLS